MKGLVEIFAMIALMLASLVLAALFYTYINGFYQKQSVTVELVDSFCVNNTAFFVIRNAADFPLMNKSLSCIASNGGCSGSCSIDNTIPAGGAAYVKVYDCPTGTHTFTLTGSSNTLQLVVYCQ